MTSRAAGTRYARALFDVARKEGDVQQAGQELTRFAEFISRHDTLAKIFSNPAIPAPKKKAVVEQLTSHASTVKV